MEVLLLIIATLTLGASVVAAWVALLSLRRPKLEVSRMKLEHPGHLSFGGKIKEEQERYDGPKPDAVLVVELRNQGKVPALRVSGSLHIASPSFCQPIDYPGYTNFRIRAAGAAAVYVVKIVPSDEHRVPAEPTREPLVFQIPVKLHGADCSRIMYRFVPEQGKAAEGEWIVGKGGYHPGPPSPCTRPVAESERRMAPSKARSGLLSWRKFFKR